MMHFKTNKTILLASFFLILVNVQARASCALEFDHKNNHYCAMEPKPDFFGHYLMDQSGIAPRYRNETGYFLNNDGTLDFTFGNGHKSKYKWGIHVKNGTPVVYTPTNPVDRKMISVYHMRVECIKDCLREKYIHVVVDTKWSKMAWGSSIYDKQ